LIISEDRQSYFARIIIDGIWKDDLVDFEDDDMAIKVAKRGLAKFVKEFTDIDIKARKMVESLKRNVPEGSPEWDVMYNKYLEDELRKNSGG
jgi:hypothetical protein